MDQKILTDVEINDDIISLQNIRKFRYTSPSEYIPDYYDADFSLDDIVSVVYVIWDERDLIELRANYRKDQVILYPITAEKKDIQKLFLSVMQRAKSLSETPEFYNTLTKTCTTSILSHVNILREEKSKSPIEWGKKIFLPSHSDEIAYDLWLIDTDLPLAEAREYYTINELSEQYAGDENYSTLIRKERR